MKLSKSGASIAVAAAAMLMSGAVATVSNAAEEGKVHCMGVNACKGTGACKTAANACKGQNACKGKGVMEMTAEECAEKGGEVVEG